jgi:hypothetical protein
MSRNQEARNAAKRRQPTASVRPGLEQLESRLVPAKVVTTLLDTTNASTPTPGSLRAAVTSNVPSDFVVAFNDYLFAASTGVTHNPTALALGNFRGAGKNDVVSASRFTTSLSFSPDDNRGLGFLSQASTTYSSSFATSNIQALEAVELNSDGKTDIITLGADGNIRAYLGNGDGTFGAPATVAVGASAAIALGDFNKDGKTDFAAALTGSTGKVVFALGNGDGTFQTSQTVTLTGTGSGNLVSLAVGDVTGDGIDDVVSLSSAGVLTTLPGDLATPLATKVATTVPGSPFTFLALGDLDGDSRADAVAVNSASGILTTVKASTATPGAFQITGTGLSTATLATGASPGIVRVADFNADGKADIAVTQYGLDNVAVYTGKGDGTLNTGPATFDVVDPTDIRVRDMNADGLPDIVASSETSQSFAVFTNSGSASFSPVAKKQATFILNGAVGAISDTLNNNLTITGGAQFGPADFDAAGNSLANLPRAIIQADVGFNQSDYDLTNTLFFSGTTTTRGSGFKVGDIIQQGITNRQGGARFQVTGVDAAGGVTTIRVIQPGSQTVYDPFSATNTRIDPILSQASTTLSQSTTNPYLRLTPSSGTGTGLAFPTVNLRTTDRSNGLFFQNTPASRSLTLDGLSLRASLDNTITVTQGSLTVTNSTFDDLDTQFGTNRGNRYFINLQTGAGSLTVTNTRFENGRLDAINGGSSGSISISNSSFSNNDGQALDIIAGTVTITNSSFTNNGDLESTISKEIYSAPPLGIGGFNGGRGMNAAGTVIAGSITVSNSLFDNNRHATIPSVDRALYLGGGTISVSNSIFRNHTNNGALELTGTKATVTASQFEGNASPLTFNSEWPTPAAAQGDRLRGGAAILIRDATPLTLTLSRFYNNKVDNVDSRFSGGGSVYLSSGTATIAECAFENNQVIITDYPNSGTPGFTNPQTSPTARYSGGGALYAGGATVIRDSYFTNNSVLSYVDVWNPSYNDSANPTQTQFSGGGAVLLTRNLDSAITSDVFNTTFVGNFVQQVEANKDINGAGKQRLDSGIAYIPLDAASVSRNTAAQSVGIDDGGTNKGQVVDGSDAVIETVLTTDAGNNNTVVTSSLAIGGSTAQGNTGVAFRAANISTTSQVATNPSSSRTLTYQLTGTGSGIVSRIIHTTFSGNIRIGGTNIQAITAANADGSLVLGTFTGATFALSGNVNLTTGLVTLVWNTSSPGTSTSIQVSYDQAGIVDLAAGDYDADTDTDFAFVSTDGTASKITIAQNVRITPGGTNPYGFGASTGGTITLTNQIAVGIAMGRLNAAGADVAVMTRNSAGSVYQIRTFLWDDPDQTPDSWIATPNQTLTLTSYATPWTKFFGADIDNNELMDLVSFNPGQGIIEYFSTFDLGNNVFQVSALSTKINLLTSATTAIATIFGADPNPYTGVSITDVAVSQLNGGGNLDISASLKLVSADPTRPTDAVMMLQSNGTANVYFVKNNRLDVLDETMNIRSNQIFDYQLDEQSTNSGIDASGKFAAAGSYLADPSRLSALGALQAITFAPRSDLTGKPLSGLIYADSTPVQRFFYDNAAGTFQYERIGIPDEFVTSASLAGTGALTLNWNSDYGATHVAVRDAAFTNTVMENDAKAVASVDPVTNALTFAADPNLPTGTFVTLSGTGTATGLFTGSRYFVIRDTATTVRLAASALDASLGKAIDITAISSPSFSLIPEDKSVTFAAVGAGFRSNTVAAYVAGSFNGFVYVNGTVVQSFSVGAGGALTFKQVNPSIYLAVPTGSSYDLLTGVLTLAFNRDISTVPVRASVTNELAASVTDFAAIPTTTLYDNAQTFVTSGSVTGTIYSGSTPVQTFSTGNKTTELTNTVAVLAGAASTTFAALAHPVSVFEDNLISNISTSLTGNQFARGVIQVNGQPGQSFTLDRGTNTGNSYPIQLTGGATPVASGTFDIVTRVLTINWAAGAAPAANVAVSMTYTTPDLIFNFTKVGNPSVFVTAATLDPITHAFSLVWNGNPEHSRMDYSFSPAESFTPGAALPATAGTMVITDDGVLPGRNTSFRVARNAVRTGSLNGTIYLGTTPVQTFEFSETGVLRLSDIGNPAVKVTAGVIDHATGTFSLFWNADVTAASPNAIVAYRQAYGVGPIAGFGQNFFTGNANQSNSTYYGSGAGFGSLTAGSLPNLPSTGRGLNGGAILVSEGRQVTGLVTANETARAGSLSVRVYNSTITANTLSNPFAMNTSNGFPDSTYLFDPTRGSRQDTAPGSNDKASPAGSGLMGDSGGLFNDTATGSAVRLLNTVVVSNTGLRYYSISAASALGFTGFARITQQDLAARPTAYGPGTFVSQGSTLYRPTASPGFNNGPVTGDLIQTDQQTNFDSFTLVDTENFRPALLGPTFTNIGSTQYQYSETETQKIKYLPLSRLSPGRDAGTGTVGAVSVASLLNGTGTDIRGANRTVNNAIDIGAFETQVASATTLLTATTPGQSGGNPVVVTPFEYGQPINLSLKSAWNDNVPPTAAVTGTVSVVRSTDAKVLGVATYGTPVNPIDISAGKSATVTFNPGSAQYPTLLEIGTNSLFGVFSGDQNYASSQSTPFDIVITKATTSVSLDPLTRVLSGSPVTITGFVSTPNSLAPLAGEGGLVVEYKGPSAGAFVALPSPTLTLASSNPNKYSFSVTVPAGTFNALGTYTIQAKFVAGGLNHYTNSDGDTFFSTTQDVVDQAKVAIQFLDGSKTAVSSPAIFPHFTQFYIRAVLADGIDTTKRTGTVDLLDSAGATVFTFPASDPNLTVSTGTASGLAAQGIADGTTVTFLDYNFANSTSGTSLGLRADDLISARYNGYPTPGTNFYLGATTANQSLDLPGIKASLSLSGPASVNYGVPYTITANLGNNGNPTANFNGGTVSLVQVLPSPTATVGTATVSSGASAANSFTGTFSNFLPTVGIQQYDATYSGDGFNYDPLTTTNPIGILSVPVAKASTKYTLLPATIYTAQSSSVPFSLTLSNNEPGASAAALTPTGTVSFYATSGASRILLGSSTNNGTSSGVFTFNYTTTAGGTYPITIDYSGDGNYLSLSNQPFGTLVVPTLSLNIGGNPANVARGAMVNFTATVAPAGTPEEQPGSVIFSFMQGTTTVATSVVLRDDSNPGTYTLSTQLGGGTLDLPNGTYTVTASYEPGASGRYPRLVSAARTLNVGLANSTTTLSATTGSGQFRYGESIALAATVAGSVGLPFGPANSTVSIFDGTTNLTPIPQAINSANASAPATQTQTVDSKNLASALSVGSHSFQARYSGDGANYTASNSAVQSVSVVKADTSLAVSSVTPASGIVASGGALALQVTISRPSYVEANAAAPTGTVVFATGGVTLGTATVSGGVATLNINPAALGNFNFTATYSGDANYNASALPAPGSYTVASVNFSPLASSIIQRGSLLTLSAAVNPATGNNSATPLGSVNFVIPGTPETLVASVAAAQAVNGVYSTTIDTGNPAFNLPVGAHTLVARYVPASGDAYPALSSSSQSLTVNRQDVILSGALAATTIPYGTTVPLVNASIAPGIANSSIAFSPASQSVDLYDGQTFVTQIPFTDGFRSLLLPTTVLEAGVHNLQLRYAGDANYRPATLSLPALTVTQAGANVSLSASANSQRAGQPFTFTAQVSAAQSGLPISPSGTVLFTVTLAGAQVAVGQVAIGALGQASFTYTPSAAVAFVVTATYSGDKNFSNANASASRTVMASALTMGAISPAVVNLGGRVTLSALMAPADQSGFSQNGTVDFVLPNGTMVARATIADSQVTASGRLYTKVVDTGIAGNNLRAGTASIRAIYVPGQNDTYPQISTDPQTLVINRQATDTLLTASPMTSLAYGTPITFTMSTSPRVAPGSADTTIPFASGGSLSLFSGGNLLQRVPVTGTSATATFTIPALNSGAQTFTAVYSGDSINFNGSTSAAVTLNIAKASTALTLSPATGATYQVGTAAKFTATLSSTVTGSLPSGTVQFFMGGVAIGSPVALSGGSASVNFTPTRSGLGALTATYSGDGNFGSSTASSNLQFRARQPFFVVASQAGSTFMTYDSKTGRQLSIFQPLGPSYKGGFRVATGDINGDGVADLAYTTSTGSFVRLMDGRTGASLGGFTAFTTTYARPVNIAIADINGDGRGDIIAAPGGAGVAANVRAFSGLNYGLIFNKTVFNPGFTGGVSVAGADIDGDGKAEIICAPFSAGGPRVQIYNAAGTLLRDQTLFATTSATGYSVTATDLNGDGRAEILLGAMSGAQQVVVSDGATGALIGSIPAFTTGSRLATVDDIDGDGIRDIVVASGVNGQSQVKRYSGRTLQQIDSFFAYAASNAARNKGLFIG